MFVQSPVAISVWRARKGGGGAGDVGDQALMRGLVTAFPIMRPRHSLSYCGRRSNRPQSVGREFLYRCPAPTPVRQGRCGDGKLAYAACTSLPIAQTKPANSRAMAVTATVSCLPRPDSAR